MKSTLYIVPESRTKSKIGFFVSVLQKIVFPSSDPDAKIEQSGENSKQEILPLKLSRIFAS